MSRRQRPTGRLLSQTAMEGLSAVALTILIGLALMGLALLDL